MAKPNSHWKNLNHKEVLIVFSGPHAYISPTWYKEEHTVPTWNYTAVHVYGIVEINFMEKTVAFYERSMSKPWTVSLKDKFIDGLMHGIVGFEITINKFEGKWK